MTKINLGNIKTGNEVVEVTEDKANIVTAKPARMPAYHEEAKPVAPTIKAEVPPITVPTEINPNLRVKILNDTYGSISYKTTRFHSIWDAGQAVQKISFSELEEVYSQPIGKRLFNSRKLVVLDPEVEAFLEIPAAQPEDLTIEELQAVWNSISDEEFENILRYCNKNTLDNIVYLAITNDTEYAKSALIRDYSGYDVETVKSGMKFDNQDGEEEPTNNTKAKRQPRKRIR